jgi:hypothetical protein
MTTKILIPIIIAVGFVAGVSSCSKDETPTLAMRITGKWLKVRYATDDNANGVLDDWEIRNVEGGARNVMEFKADSTGIEYTTGSPDLPFYWALTAEQSMLFSYKNSDTILCRITRINSVDLFITTTGKNGVLGYYYNRTN